MKNTLETRLGLFVALAFVAAVIILEMVGSLDIFHRGYPLRARFNNVQELKKGDPVRMAGVDIGRVENIDIADSKVEVTLRVRSSAKVKTDSKATIRFVGLLGQNYVSIGFGTPTAPSAGPDTLLETVEQPDLSAILAKIDTVATGVEGLTKSLGGDTINNILGPAANFLKENNPKITAILGNMQTISSQIAQGKGTVGRLINDDQLYNLALGTVTNLNSTADELKLTISQARNIVDQINQGQGTIGRLAKDESLFREATNAMTNLREIFQKINQGQGSVGKLVNDEALYRNVRMTLQKVDKATEGLEDQGPLSVLGIAVGNLF
jgi:phospholipid/cholesterol/gamma-HCH transport system substrate-binding protein